MAEQRILFLEEDGSLSIIMPTGELPINEIAKKDVPAGRPYLIVERSVIPEDRSFRNAWEVDFSNPDGHGIGSEAWWAAQEAS